MSIYRSYFTKKPTKFYIGEDDQNELLPVQTDRPTAAEAVVPSEDERDEGNGTSQESNPMSGFHRVPTMYGIHTYKNGVVKIIKKGMAVNRNGILGGDNTECGQLMKLMRGGGNGGGGSGRGGLQRDVAESGDVEEGRSTPPVLDTYNMVSSDVVKGFFGSGAGEGTQSKPRGGNNRWSWPQVNAELGRFTPPTNFYDEHVASDVDEGLFSGTDDGTVSDIDVEGVEAVGDGGQGGAVDVTPTAGCSGNGADVVCPDCCGLRDVTGQVGGGDFKDECELCTRKPCWNMGMRMCTIM